jgi:hypothetical protein
MLKLEDNSRTFGDLIFFCLRITIDNLTNLECVSTQSALEALLGPNLMEIAYLNIRLYLYIPALRKSSTLIMFIG